MQKCAFASESGPTSPKVGKCPQKWANIPQSGQHSVPAPPKRANAPLNRLAPHPPPQLGGVGDCVKAGKTVQKHTKVRKDTQNILNDY
jgi:hypothetical protein